METYNIYKNLVRLNELPPEDAKSLFRSCSSSDLWADRMVAARPFALVENLFEAADGIWSALPPSERVSSFTDVTDNSAESELAETARLYNEKFGFIFVLSSSGKSFDEMLAICRARLGNSVQTELRIAADEQRKIIEIRLNKLLER